LHPITPSQKGKRIPFITPRGKLSGSLTHIRYLAQESSRSVLLDIIGVFPEKGKQLDHLNENIDVTKNEHSKF
jgi:hypothetical protein